MGATGHTETFIPDLTVNFAAHKVGSQETIPMCTLHFFPENIEHCIAWAKDRFGGSFESEAKNVNQFVCRKDFLENLASKNNTKTQIRILRSTIKHLDLLKSVNFAKCVEIARLEFEEIFANKIKIILHSFPPEFVDENGPFWRPPRRVPKPLIFDEKDPLHLLFVEATAHLLAFSYNVKDASKDRQHLLELLSKVHVPEFKPKKLTLEALNSGEAEEGFGKSDEEVLDELSKSLPSRLDFEGLEMAVASFEKDDDTNYHVDFVHAVGNLRASNYGITNIDRLKTRKVVGNIIPAIATTTASVVGLINLELYKYLQGKNTVEDYNNWNVDMAQPYFSQSDPDPPSKNTSDDKVKAVPEGWTVWDSIELKFGDVLIGQVRKHLKEKFGLDVSTITCEDVTLFRSYDDNKAEVQKMKVGERYMQLKKLDSLPSYLDRLDLSVIATTEDNKPALVPPIRFFLSKKKGGKSSKKRKVEKNESN